MNEKQPMIVSHEHDQDHGTLGLYVSGFVLSVCLTLAAYLMVTHHTLSKWPLVAAIATLAIVQFLVQLTFFLHIGREARPRWRLGVLGFMLLIVLIIVIGSLWIMNNLNYRMTSQDQINNYLQKQDGGI